MQTAAAAATNAENQLVSLASGLPSAQSILDQSGPAGLTEYLDAHPEQELRIQRELRPLVCWGVAWLVHGGCMSQLSSLLLALSVLVKVGGPSWGWQTAPCIGVITRRPDHGQCYSGH